MAIVEWKMGKRLSSSWLLFILTGLNLLNYMDRYVVNAVRSPLAADFGIGYGASGQVFTIFMVGYFITSPVFGYLGDRVSRKSLIACGIFVWSLGTVLTGFAHDFVTLLGFRAMVGVGEAAYATLGPALIADAWGPAKRNNALTIFYAAIPIGSAIGYMLGGEIAAHWGWRYAFFWAGAPGLFIALVLLPFQEPRRGESEPEEGGMPGPAQSGSLLGLFRNRDFNLAVWGYVAYTFALGAFAFWGPTFLERVHHLSLEKADNFFGIVIIAAGLLGTLGGGFTATWWQRKNPAGYALMLTGSIFLAFPLSLFALLAASAASAMGLLAAAIFFLFLCTGPINTVILEAVPATLRASAMAVSIFMIHLFGDLWSPEIVGRLADRMNGDLQKAVLILPGALLVAAVLWLILALKTARGGRAHRSG